MKTVIVQPLIVLISVLVCFSVAGSLFANWRPFRNRKIPLVANLPFVDPSPSPSPVLVKEYIYAGSRLLATEEPLANVAPTVNITSPVNNAVSNAPANITIDANASDSDGSITQVEFYQGTTLLNTDTVAPYSFTWTSVGAGTYSLTAKATDNRGALTPSSPINVIVNAPPTVSIISPVNNTVLNAPANIMIDASPSDSDGSITQVEFYQGTTLLNTDTVPPYSFAWTNVPAGTYSLTARATDNRGALTPSSPINITVNPGCTPPAGMIISEFRLRGPNGSNDEYIELYNNTDSAITICTADGSAGWALVSSDGITRFVLAGHNVPGPLALPGGGCRLQPLRVQRFHVSSH